MLKQVETEHIYVEYESKTEACSHAFGSQITESKEIMKIEVYIPALKEWLDVTHMSNFDELANDLINTKGA